MAEEKKKETTAEEKSMVDKFAERLRIVMFRQEGFCANCLQRVEGWKEPYYDEVKSAIQNNGINPKTGHRTNCAG